MDLLALASKLEALADELVCFEDDFKFKVAFFDLELERTLFIYSSEHVEHRPKYTGNAKNKMQDGM